MLRLRPGTLSAICSNLFRLFSLIFLHPFGPRQIYYPAIIFIIGFLHLALRTTYRSSDS
ncbi:hypothetical protein BDN72DRAFT_318088 [Pluteus cervinus]|uniref:Uncharacterized protein n=1 Tax=Pluteus cervinus TaxID=181527 RepID=A0ACD3B3I9_9AGAR|nr:hypothetical protein BDN72DRAFT_318088 [Pluteus cervinus]